MRTKGVPIGSPDLNGSPAEETRHKNEAESKNRNTQWMIRLTLKKEKEKRKTRGDLVLTLDVKIDHRPSTPEWNFEIKKEPNREYLTGGSLIWFRSGLGSSHLVVIEMRNQRRRRSAAAPPKVTEQQKKMICEEKKKETKSDHVIRCSGHDCLTDRPGGHWLPLPFGPKEKKMNGKNFEWKSFCLQAVGGGGGGGRRPPSARGSCSITICFALVAQSRSFFYYYYSASVFFFSWKLSRLSVLESVNDRARWLNSVNVRQTQRRPPRVHRSFESKRVHR